MKKTILAGILYCISTPLLAANIIAYENKVKGEAEFLFLNSQQIMKITYEEEDKLLTVFSNQGPGLGVWKFSVDTLEKSQEIIHKLFDKTNTDLIELKFD